MPFKKITTSQIAKLLLVVLAVAIQIQITLFESDDYLGLRINLADLIIPFPGLFILTSLLLQKSVWPQFSLQKAYMWLGALGCVLVAALVHSYLNFNTLSMWGLQNKIIGWIVLCSFFLMGGWITSNTKIENILQLLKISLSLLLSIIIVQVVLQTIFFNFSIRLLANDFGHFP
ncbi:MAG: hypothetical protein HRT94_08915, partial [Alphaproteobacteria bacterium]|nr:hypothetical protein [Alphaproteobacteria bacterium]